MSYTIIKDFRQINEKQWNELIAISSNATWFQTKEAFLFFSSQPTIFSPFFFAIINDNILKAITIGYTTQYSNAIKQFFTRRSIILGGPLLHPQINNKELSAYLKYIKEDLKQRSIYIETRNFCSYAEWKEVFEQNGFNYKPHLNFIVDCSSLSIIQKNVSHNKIRNIKISLREGAKTISSPSLAQIKEFYDILHLLYKTKVRTPLFPFTFFEHLYRLPSSVFLLVEYKNKIIGGFAGISLSNRILHEWFICGLDKNIPHIYPSALARYASLIHANESGCSYYDMMGAGSPNQNYGVRENKRQFGGILVENGRFIHIQHPLLYKLGCLIVKIIKKIP